MATDSSLEKLIRADHDTLVRLEANFAAFVLENRQGNLELARQVSDHEARIRLQEAEAANLKTALRTVKVIGSIIATLLALVASYVATVHGILRP